MNLIIWWLNHMKRCIVVPTGCEYMLWGPRAEIVDDAAKTVGRCGGLLIKNLGQLEDVTLRLALCMKNGGPSTRSIVPACQVTGHPSHLNIVNFDQHKYHFYS